MNYLSTGAGSLPSTVRSFAGGAAINTARWIHWTLMHGPSYCPRIMMSCCSKEHKVLPWQTEVHVGSRHVSHGSKGVYWHVPRFGCSFLAPAILTQILIMVSWTSILYWDPPPSLVTFQQSKHRALREKAQRPWQRHHHCMSNLIGTLGVSERVHTWREWNLHHCQGRLGYLNSGDPMVHIHRKMHGHDHLFPLLARFLLTPRA